LDPLVEPALVHLADRALRTRRTAGPQPGPHAIVRPGADALLAVDADERLPHDRIAVDAPPARQREDVRRARPPDAVDAPAAPPGHHLALAGEGRARDLPSVTDRTDPLRVGDTRPLEEHLVEVDLAADVTQRPHLDAGLVQVEQEVRDALAFRSVGIRA